MFHLGITLALYELEYILKVFKHHFMLRGLIAYLWCLASTLLNYDRIILFILFLLHCSNFFENLNVIVS